MKQRLSSGAKILHPPKISSNKDKKNEHVLNGIDSPVTERFRRSESQATGLGYRRRSLFFIELAIIVGSFFLTNYFKQGTFSLEPANFNLFLLFVTTCLLASGFFKKFQYGYYKNFRAGFLLIVKSCVAALFLITIVLVMIGNYSFSRTQMFGTWLIYLMAELSVFLIYYLTVGKKITSKQQAPSKEIYRAGKLSFAIIAFDFIVITSSFIIMNYFKRGTIEISENYESLIIIFYGLWFGSGIFTGKFEIMSYRNIYYALSPFLKAFLIMVSMMSVLIYAFNLFYLSYFQGFGSLILLIIIELIFYSFYHLYFLDKKKVRGVKSNSEDEPIIEQKGIPVELLKAKFGNDSCLNPAKEKLENHYFNNRRTLFNFIAKYINLNLIDETDAIVLDTKAEFDKRTFADQSYYLFINFNKINDMRHINQYFIEVNAGLNSGGYFVGHAHTIETHKEWFYAKFPFYMARILYPLDFIYRRIIPKLPEIKKVYFLLTKGKNRILSKAEILGRLNFCGFEVVATNDMGNCFYFIAKRIKNPSDDKHPSYGPIVKLKRVGLNGKIISIHKFRTMHPYSEYLQDYVYQQQKLNSNGKFNDDFRVTNWGSWLRKLWIDELPQIINFWRGDISLVGVRAISEHYFSLYDKDLQQLRIGFKPGLIPPYYADLPNSFEEIMNSERKYFNEKISHPFSTDIKYFFRAFYNIVIKHARSY